MTTPNTMSAGPPTNTAFYFVDESGDGVLFNAKGQVLVGQPGGAMGHFIMGLLEADDPMALSAELAQLRAELAADPYFRTCPRSAGRGKTAVAFPAKDDLPEVRREVFKLLLRHQVKSYAVVRDMHAVLAYVRERNARGGIYRYHPNELYDNTVARLFKNRLHQYESCHVCYAVRGSSDRTKAFASALELARDRFAGNGTNRSPRHPGHAGWSAQQACLQAVDYLCGRCSGTTPDRRAAFWT
ncbi:MAG: hypothetical protein IPI16_01590 [Comamonadaceae bacterium]|nr:hypothetical protein [Comamonadaceae bacterium]